LRAAIAALLIFNGATMSEQEARNLLSQVLNEKWLRERRAVLGSQLKAALIDAASKSGSEFDETQFGYRNFAEFLKQTGVVALKFREGTDILVTPIEHPEALEDSNSRPRIRRDFWEAFIGFPVPGELRGYNPATDSIRIAHSGTLPDGTIPIEPASKELQLSWRKDFLEFLGVDSPVYAIKDQLNDFNAFRTFSQALRAHPTFQAEWNRVWVNAALNYITDWARKQRVPGTPWLFAPEPNASVQSHFNAPIPSARESNSERQKLYLLLDQIPLDKLSRLQVPLGWFIGKDSKGD
jgi:hypothetical protein